MVVDPSTNLLGEFGQIALFLILSILFTVMLVLLPVALRYVGLVPRKPSPAKQSTYECGMQTIGETWVRFNFRYYLYALIFLLFDILAVFLFPWAAGLRGEGRAFGLLVMGMFLFVLVVGLLFAWKKGALEWK